MIFRAYACLGMRKRFRFGFRQRIWGWAFYIVTSCFLVAEFTFYSFLNPHILHLSHLWVTLYSHLAQLVQKRTIASVNIYSLLIDLRRQAKLLPLINLTPYLCIQYHGEGALSLNNLGDDNVVNSI